LRADFSPQAVRQYDGYHIDAFDVKKKSPISRTDADEDFLQKYDTDRRSIFVGGLPLEAQRQEVLELFSTVGEVINCNVIARSNFDGQFIPFNLGGRAWATGLTTSTGYVSRVFAFVEFSRADAPDAAVKHFVCFAHKITGDSPISADESDCRTTRTSAVPF
jgi:hypothetical protein